MGFCPAGLATGIGSLPFPEPEQALELIWENMPVIPHWPQLPQRGREEGFIFQFLTPLVKKGVLKIDAERAFFNPADPEWVTHLTEFYTLYLQAQEGDQQALEEFAFPREAARGFYAFAEQVRNQGVKNALYLKGQLTGPLTIGFQLKDEEGRPAYYNEQLRDLCVKTLALHARWQAFRLLELGCPAIIFVDDPAIRVYGQFGFITVTKEMIAAALGEVVQAIHQAGTLAGLHSCDAVDWSILLESELDIVNLDAYNFGESLFPYAREIKAFLERGGTLAWGIVPTSEKAWEENEVSLRERLISLWNDLEKRGVQRDLLKNQSLITPACGTGLLTMELARQIYRLSRAVSEAFRGTTKCI